MKIIVDLGDQGWNSALASDIHMQKLLVCLATQGIHGATFEPYVEPIDPALNRLLDDDSDQHDAAIAQGTHREIFIQLCDMASTEELMMLIARERMQLLLDGVELTNWELSVSQRKTPVHG